MELTHANIPEIYRAGSLSIIDSFIILTNTRNDGNQIHIYNQNFKLIGSSGQKGSGPGELVNPFHATIDPDNKAVWFCDMGRRRVLKYPLDSILMNQEYRPSEFVPVPKELKFLLVFGVHNDSLFSFIEAPQQNNLISFFDLKGNIKDHIFVKDNLKLCKSDSLLNSSVGIALNYDYCYHPEKKLIAITYLSSDIISIIDASGKVLSITQGPDNINEIMDMNNPFQIFTHQGIKCDKNYIYCSYLGGPAIEKGKKESNFPSCIHVFDWYGNPVAKLMFDTHIGSFEIDRDNHKLIIFSADSGDLMYCDLPL